MPASTETVVEALFTAIRTLTSDENYKAISRVFDEIPLLKKEIESRDTEVARVKKEISSLNTSHEKRLQEELELYRKQHNRLDGEKAQLSKIITDLKAALEQKDNTVATLNRAQETSQGQLDLVKKSLNEEKKKAATTNTEITKLQQVLKAKDTELDKLKESLRDQRTAVSRIESQVRTLREEKTTLERNLQLRTTRLGELEGFATELHDEDETIWINRLDSVWESARRLVEPHFKEDLQEDSLEDLVKNLKASQFLDNPIPLPRSNSLAAKRMRIAAMLAILARSINQYIFQPTYIFDEDEEIRLLLIRLAASNSRKESFGRAFLLSIDPDKQAKKASKRVEQVATEVARLAQDSLSIEQYESFRSGLQEVAKEACEVWQTVQLAKEKFELYFDLQHDDEFEWEPLRFEDGGSSPGEQSRSRDEELLVIFPRIYSIEDAEPDPITNGVVLMKSQSMEAAEEMERRKPSSPTTGKAIPRSRLNKPRNKSISLNGGSNFLSQITPSGAH